MKMFSNRILAEDLDYIDRQFGRADCFSGKTVLLTGCAGFLGFSFVHYFLSLLNKGIKLKLVLLDNFMLGKPPWLLAAEQIGDGDARVLPFDIGRQDIATVAEAADAAFIIHMASIASPSFYRQYPLETIDANVWGLRRLLEYYRDRPIEGFLFFSSSEVYGDPDPRYIPTSEGYLGNVATIGPRACYDESKRFGETLCYVFASKYGLPIRVVRPFNNYGPGMSVDDKRVPADFAKAVLCGEDIMLFSDGTPTRTFSYVADAVVGYLKALLHHQFDYFNIGIDRPETSVSSLAEIYVQAGRELLGYQGGVSKRLSEDPDYLTHNPSRRCPDISKAQKLLDYHPAITVYEGVRRFLLYLHEERGVK